jgi:hypothetical protein
MYIARLTSVKLMDEQLWPLYFWIQVLEEVMQAFANIVTPYLGWKKV